MIITNHFNKTIELTKADARNAGKYGSEEYNLLTQIMKDFPSYSMVIKSAPKRDNYKGLTLEYMENYIKQNEKDTKVINDFYALRGKDENGKDVDFALVASYGEIKKWFLDKYPSVAEFGRNKIDEILKKKTETENEEELKEENN